MANSKDDINRQTKTIQFRVTESEFDKLKKSGAVFGKSASLYTKDLALKSRLKKPKFDHQIASEILLELSRQGNNLNQLTRKVNRMSATDPELFFTDFQAELTQLSGEVARLREEYQQICRRLQK
mgnify:CR=1 FL=1